MSTGDGKGPEEERPSGEERRRTPPPGRRTPPPRRRSSGSGEVEHRSTKRNQPKGSLFGRLIGRQGLDDALQERFKPYEYESSRPMLRWLFLALLVFTGLSAYGLFTDFQFRSEVNEWRTDGLTEIPIDNEDIASASFVVAAVPPDTTAAEICATEEDAVNATPTPDPEDPDATPGPPIGTSVLHQSCNALDRVLEYAVASGIDCTTPEEFGSVVRNDVVEHPGCTRLVDFSSRFDSLETNTTIATVLLVLTLIITAFPFSSFAHRSSRNLRTLKSEGQKHSPDGLVIRFFIPVVNIYKPFFMFIELFKASDPRVDETDPEAWKKKGIPSPIVVMWGLAWAAVVIYNPITTSQLFFRDQFDLADVSRTTTALMVADVFLIALGILAILMANTLSKWQDARAAKYGTVTVTPPRPRDPLEKALEEGVRRQNKERSGDKGKRSRRRRK